MTVPIVTATGMLKSEGLEKIKSLGKCFWEVLEDMGAATVRFFGEERREFVQDEFEKIPENAREILYVPAWAFFNASYLVGRPAVEGAEAAGTGAGMIYNASKETDFASEEFWMGVSGLLAGTGAVVGTFAIAASPKPPIGLTTIPTDLSMTMGASGGRGAMAPAMAVAVSTTAVPAVSTEAAAAAAAGILAGPTVMYATSHKETNGQSEPSPWNEHTESSPWLDTRDLSDLPLPEDTGLWERLYFEDLAKTTSEVMQSKQSSATKGNFFGREIWAFEGKELSSKIYKKFLEKGYDKRGGMPRYSEFIRDIDAMIKFQLRTANAWFEANNPGLSFGLAEEMFEPRPPTRPDPFLKQLFDEVIDYNRSNR